MGIEDIAWIPQASDNHGVVSEENRCVRFLCEKRCRDSQRQPMRASATCRLKRRQSGQSEARKRKPSRRFAVAR
jgi:hypothetical protein